MYELIHEYFDLFNMIVELLFNIECNSSICLNDKSNII